MKATFTLVDELGNAGTPTLNFEAAEIKLVYFYPKLPSGAPFYIPYSVTGIQLDIQGKTGTIVKDFSSGINILGGYQGFYIIFSSADTDLMPTGVKGVNVTVTMVGPTFKYVMNIPMAFVISPAIVS